jgi:lipopolysaccharide export system protein LptC
MEERDGRKVKALADQAHREGEGALSDAYRRALRHSRRVRALKVVLPVTATSACLIFGAYAWFVSATGASVSLFGSEITDGKLVMANPRIEGFTGASLPYRMTAARAIQDLGDTNRIALEDIDALLPISPQNSAAVDAQRGVYYKDSNILEIDKDMTVTLTDGTVAHFQSARIDLDSGELSSQSPVTITSRSTRINADSMTVAGKGKHFVFERRVRVMITPGAVSSAAHTGGPDDAIR